MGGWCLPYFAIFLCLVSVPSVTLASWCVWDWSPQYTLMYSFEHLDPSSLTFNSFWPTFLVAYNLTLFALGGVLLLFLILPWFVGVSYVFNIWSYVLGDCSGWIPMHFGEMDHLPYRHSSFHSYFGCNRLFQWRFFRSAVTFDRALWLLHTLVVFYMIIFCSYHLAHSLVWKLIQSFTSFSSFFPSLFGVWFLPYVLLYFSSF